MRFVPLLWLSACAALALLAGLAWPERNPVATATMPQALTDSTATVAASVPERLSTVQWQTLQTELANDPQRDAEMARIVSLLSFQADVHTLAAWRTSGRVGAERTALAQRLAAGLPGHLAQRELSLGEARALHAMLTEELGAAAGPPPEPRPAGPDARDATFLAAQQQAVARWNAQPEGQRHPDALLTELDALRARHYPPPPP